MGNYLRKIKPHGGIQDENKLKKYSGELVKNHWDGMRTNTGGNYLFPMYNWMRMYGNYNYLILFNFFSNATKIPNNAPNKKNAQKTLASSIGFFFYKKQWQWLKRHRHFIYKRVKLRIYVSLQLKSLLMHACFGTYIHRICFIWKN